MAPSSQLGGQAVQEHSVDPLLELTLDASVLVDVCVADQPGEEHAQDRVDVQQSADGRQAADVKSPVTCRAVWSPSASRGTLRW